MYTKTLLLALSVAAFSSCSTTYKSGQTPDDVYYSPVRYTETEKEEERQEVKQSQTTTIEDRDIRMCIRDRRWREFNSRYNDGYGYNYSPYGYADCSCNTQNYYYNQYYYPTPVYFGKISAPVSNVPRKVNLNAYDGYTPVVTNGKTGSNNGTNWANPPKKRYNNSNDRSGSTLGNLIRQVITPSSNTNDRNSSTPTDNNNTRTYNPPASSNSGSSNSGSSSAPAGSVTRPGRGGK
jgi:hypothetical protein